MKAIVVFYDSLNKRCLPNYESDCKVEAPNFKRLGEHSVTFDNSYVGSMPCMPARRELHTGRYNFLHREWGPLEPFDDSMPEILKSNGVYTHIVSDHLHYWEDGGCNYHTRFSSWEIVRGQEGDHWKGHVGNVEIPPCVSVPPKQDGTGIASGWRYDWINRSHIKQENEYPGVGVFDLGCEFIKDNHQEDDWLLQIETFDPHEPFFSPDKYQELYPEEYEGKHFDWPRGEVKENESEIEHCRNQYRALVSMCDQNLGKVLDLMDTYDMWKDTMLIVGTDHGFLLAEHGYWGKNQMPYYNEIANTPFFLWDPRYNVRDEHRSSIVQLIDWAPTLLDFFSLKVPKDMQGKPLNEVVKDDIAIRNDAIFGVFSGHVNITDGHYVYMRASYSGRENEIYNYTLMPMYMTRRIPVNQLKDMQLVEPFSFTKECKVLKIKGSDKYGVSKFGNLLYDIKADPLQLHPIQNEKIETMMINKLIQQMKNNDCPKEQYYRLGLEQFI
ncbi:MAG: sulfatase [Longicatena sp.]